MQLHIINLIYDGFCGLWKGLKGHIKAEGMRNRITRHAVAGSEESKPKK